MSCFLGFWEFARSSRMVQIKIWKPTGWVSTIKVRLSDVQIKLNESIDFTKTRNSLRRFVHSLPWPSTVVKYTRKMRSSTLPRKMAFLKDTCRSVGFFISTLVVLLACFDLTEAGGKTLVLLDNANTKETHSIFFNSERKRIWSGIPLCRWLKPLSCKIRRISLSASCDIFTICWRIWWFTECQSYRWLYWWRRKCSCGKNLQMYKIPSLDWVSSINQSFVLTRFVEELRTRSKYERV